MPRTGFGFGGWLNLRLPDNVGEPCYGGYFAGIIDTTKGNIVATDAFQSGAKYMLIVAPKSLETMCAWDTTGSRAAPAGARTRWNGLGATVAEYGGGAAYAAATYCYQLAYPADTGSRWYLPAMDEFELIYRNLKPTSDQHSDSVAAYSGAAESFPYNAVTFNAGYNPSSSPNGGAYTAESPSQTSVALFKSGGPPQALFAADALHGYWTSTEYRSASAWGQYTAGTSTGFLQANAKTNATIFYVRPVRRIYF